MTLTVDDVRAEARSQVACVERAHRQQLREALVEVSRHLGWDRQTVMRLSEAITGVAVGVATVRVATVETL